MTFTSETAKILGAKGNDMKAKYKEDRMAYISSGGINKSLAVIDLMLEGEKVTAEQKEAVKLLGMFVPYKLAKKLPVNGDGESKMTIEIKTI